jgi:hypothetical protein
MVSVQGGLGIELCHSIDPILLNVNCNVCCIASLESIILLCAFKVTLT